MGFKSEQRTCGTLRVEQWNPCVLEACGEVWVTLSAVEHWLWNTLKALGIVGGLAVGEARKGTLPPLSF